MISMISRCMALLAVASLLSPRAVAQSLDPQVSTKRLVVMIYGKVGGVKTVGSGLIYGRTDNRLHVVTARHVIEDKESQEQVEDLEVIVAYGMKGDQWSPKLKGMVVYRDSQFDLATLDVELPDDVAKSLGELSFSRLADWTNLSDGIPLSLLGRGGGKPWNRCMGARLDLSYNAEQGLIPFEYGKCGDGGYSGGVVLNSNWEILAIHLKVDDDNAHALALSMSTVIARLVEAKAPPVLLRAATPPRITQFLTSEKTIKAGKSVALMWSSVGTEGCFLEPDHKQVEPSGVKVLEPDKSTEYRLFCVRGGDQVFASTKVEVEGHPEVLSFEAEPSRIAVAGNVTLSWTTRGAIGCVIEGIGDVETQGKRIVRVERTSTYVLRCHNGTEVAKETAEVALIPPVSIEAFSATPQVVIKGGTSSLSWKASNSEGCLLDNGVGEVGTSGSRRVAPTVNTTYELTCQGAAGAVSKQVSIEVRVPPPPPKPRILSFDATPSEINRGDSSQLEWDVQGADACSINRGIGSVDSSSGSEDVMPSSTTTYTLTCRSSNESVSEPATVRVLPPPPKRLYCCDGRGMKWCPIVVPGGVSGMLCYCTGVPGAGVMCE